MKIIIGLGNPDYRYDGTYHNTGFHTVDYIASKLGISFNKVCCDAVCAECIVGGEKLLLAKPLTYMNLSGKSVKEFVNYYKISLADLLIVSDDIDLQKGKFRFRDNSSAGTHNGLKSIVKELGTMEFKRVRIGIGREENQDLADYVLSKIDEESQTLIDESIVEASKLIFEKLGLSYDGIL